MLAARARVRLEDIRREIDGVRRATARMSFDDFEQSWVVMRATQHALLIIGEAAKNLPDDLEAGRSDIPWARISSLGNFLRHEYARIDHRLIWDIVENHLQPLYDAVGELLVAFQQDTS